MVSTKAEALEPQSHPIADNAPECCPDFEGSDEDAGCQSDEDNLLDVSEPTDTEVRSYSTRPISLISG